MDLIAVVILLGIVQGVFLGTLLLLSRGPNRRANVFLGVLFICYSLSILHFFLDRAGLYLYVPHLSRVGIPVLFLFGPLFYFYVRTLTDRTVRLRWRDLLHGIPFLLVVLMFLPYFLSSAEEKLRVIASYRETVALGIGLAFSVVQVLHVFAYLLAVRPILKRYDDNIRNTRSSIERINLRWLGTGVVLYYVVFGIILLLIMLQFAGFDAYPAYNLFIPLIVTATIYGLGYLGLRQPEIFSPSEELSPGRKYERSSLTPGNAREYAERLSSHMESARPYLDPELTLPALALQLGIPAYQLSQVINESVGVNFFDYVNGFRVGEAKRLLLDPSKSAFTILAVAEEAGFTSKSAFNTAFKKYAGVTPSDFRSVNQRPG